MNSAGHERIVQAECDGVAVPDGCHDFAVVLADIDGSNRLYETHGDAAAKELLSALKQGLALVARRAGSLAIQVAGDEVMCHFDDVDAAAGAAFRMHELGDVFSRERGARVFLRIGINFGPVLFEGGRVYGETINVAYRLTSRAKRQQSITTQRVLDRLSDRYVVRARRFDTVKVKGKYAPLVIFDLPWQRAEVTRIQTDARMAGSAVQRLELHYGKEVQVVTVADSGFSIGRHSECGLVVSNPCVSRIHAQVQFVHGKFVLNDQSTNGSYVTTKDGQSTYLRREPLPLWGRGQIGLGKPVDHTGSHCLGFVCF
jgi:class 3 adenylate cyclase